MNSLPFISHHLFVAAIANEGRGRERPARRERPFTAPVDQASAIALEVMDALNRCRRIQLARRGPGLPKH
jgi:hypothetical protein